MASTKAHRASGWAAGLIAAAIVTKANAAGPYHIWSIASCLAAVAGGTAPDWLELAWWRRSPRGRWIAHRSWTHWGIAWIGLMLYAYLSLTSHPLATVLLGFATGGVMHLLADWPNPLGVPWIMRRHSLNWWKSGHCDLIIIGVAWLAALWIASHVWASATRQILLWLRLHLSGFV